VKWARRIVLLAPALSCIVMAWQAWPDWSALALLLIAAPLWAWHGWRRIKEVEIV